MDEPDLAQAATRCTTAGPGSSQCFTATNLVRGLAVVDASTSVTVSASVSQTAAQATTAGGLVTLRPGQRITCQRIYSRIVSKITEVTYYPMPQNSTTRTYSTTTPSSLGVRFVD